jgi:hypothetical protein
MNKNWTYWMTKARFGLVLAIGAVLAAYSFRNDNDGVGYVFAVGTVIVAALVFLTIDRRQVNDHHA